MFDVLSGLIWVKTARKSYQQMTLGDKGLRAGVLFKFLHCYIFCKNILKRLDHLRIDKEFLAIRRAISLNETFVLFC